MNYYRMTPYKKQHIDAIRALAALFSVKLLIRFNYKYPTADIILEGSPEIIELKINKKTSISALFTAFFHELGHVYCKDRKIYPLYHYWDTSKYNKKERTHMLRICGRAEMYADKIGKKLMKEYYPEIPYIMAYTKSTLKEWLGEELRQSIKLTFEAMDKDKKKKSNLNTCH